MPRIELDMRHSRQPSAKRTAPFDGCDVLAVRLRRHAEQRLLLISLPPACLSWCLAWLDHGARGSTDHFW
jgi:hypothetical protein